MTNCVICGRRCIPMADYDVPVCIDCDERMATVLALGPLPEPLRPVRLDDLHAWLRVAVTEGGAA